MIKNWLKMINWGLIAVVLLLAASSFVIHWSRKTEILIPEPMPAKTSLPQGAFTLSKEKYDAIGPPFMSLSFSPIALQLPDLRNYLVYHGRNERPDASREKSMLHFEFSGSQEVVSIPPESPLFLVYDEEQPRVKYRFSPNNRKSSLWIEATPMASQVSIRVSMRNETGKVIRKPKEYANFTLKEKPFPRFGAKKWTIGKWKVDGTLLARQRARWYGKDLFLERHGGEEYQEFQEKQRIDFGQNPDAYSVYIGAENALAWINERWVEIKPNKESQAYPLLVVNKVEDRLMKLELWDVDGRSKLHLNLIKSIDTSLPQNVAETFKFVGARTRSQLMFEVNQKRILVSPQDWLLFLEGDWLKVDTPDEIDAYVEKKVSGPLFVIDEIKDDDGKKSLVGTLFNTTRTAMKTVEIPLQQGIGPTFSKPHPKKKKTRNVAQNLASHVERLEEK